MAPDDLGSTTTQPGTATTVDQDTIVPRAAGHAIVLPDAGYAIGELIGRGGMGEVVRAHDRRIGRDVAIKRMRGETPTDAAVTRFLREARIQARLDHPAIVPVYELGVDDQGQPYFTMKRLTGVTLGQRLTEPVGLRVLLRAFVDVCLAIEFAHTRRVVHRDLKPANIMLGDFGEVYVIDWGIARVLDARRAASEAGDIDTLETPEAATQAGDLLGTPGYMAPEQVRGGDVGPAADVYALGAILFEILAREPLHPRGTAALASTLTTPQASPAARAPGREIPPELELACVAALAEGIRPTARELGDRVQRYLDGDRDLEARRARATELLAVARAAYDSGDPEQRPVAIRSAGHALALDAASVEAAHLVMTMLIEPPRKLPTALVAEIAELERDASVARIKESMKALAGFFSVIVLLPWMGIRSWTTLGTSLGIVAVAVGAMAVAVRLRRPSPYMNLVVGLGLAIAFSRVLGPFVLTPVVIAASTLAATANRALFSRPFAIMVWIGCAALAPVALESIGVFQSTWTMIPGGVSSTSAIFDGINAVDPALLVIANLILLVAVGGYAVRVNRTTSEARHDLHVQAWQLRQLLPTARA